VNQNFLIRDQLLW